MAPLLHFDLLDQRQRQQLLQQAQALARTQAFQHAHAPPPQQPPRLAYSRVSASRPSQQQLLHARQATVTTTAAAGSHHLSGGAIAGIVIGCIVGVLLLAWILRLCLNPPPAWRQAWHRHRSPARRHHRHHSDPGDRVGKHNNTANTHRHTRSDARRPEIEIIQKPTPVVVRRRSTSRRRTTFGKATTAVRASHGERKADDGPSETVERGRKPRRFYETYSGRA
ncbi:hypothetical protein CMQ_6799 [Grosmannia clavigera kw1407]|uniref:Uncharacterized protein n=1 Tax=Grosmannia clavigera (strain kw1407 / UAMH 11150) TaxID=655863 RepID=F0X766_GROCL|nr:uncharacterized protein CMQ_6799 [Grosmannia clavigera kw1407]EFX06478.1 hypothetical protein CMQ_6799 [Grosmannia clavigera kw1407]